MPSLCYPTSCPPYTFPTEAEIKKEEEAAEAERLKWTKWFQEEVTLEQTPKTEVEKCQEYCKLVAKAEAEKAKDAREKVAYALKLAGCPSRVVAPTKKKKTATASTSKTSKKPAATKSGLRSELFHVLATCLDGINVLTQFFLFYPNRKID